MSEEKQRAPLHFFTSDDLSDSGDNSSNSSDEEEKGYRPAASALKHLQATKRDSAGVPLPKPDELFSSVSKPAFLYNPLNKQIDWESRIVKAPEEPPKEFKVWKSNAVPPPQSYVTEEKKGAPPGKDMAIKWSNVYEDNGDDAPRAKSSNKLFEDKALNDSDDEKNAGASSKKKKVESFQQKEKRKRDFGQATSDKTFVEEEKRILRQAFE